MAVCGVHACRAAVRRPTRAAWRRKLSGEVPRQPARAAETTTWMLLLAATSAREHEQLPRSIPPHEYRARRRPRRPHCRSRTRRWRDSANHIASRHAQVRHRVALFTHPEHGATLGSKAEIAGSIISLESIPHLPFARAEVGEKTHSRCTSKRDRRRITGAEFHRYSMAFVRCFRALGEAVPEWAVNVLSAVFGRKRRNYRNSLSVLWIGGVDKRGKVPQLLLLQRLPRSG